MQNLTALAMHRNNISGAHASTLHDVQHVHAWPARMLIQQQHVGVHTELAISQLVTAEHCTT